MSFRTASSARSQASRARDRKRSTSGIVSADVSGIDAPVPALAQLLEPQLGIAQAAPGFAKPADAFLEERERAIEIEVFLLQCANDLLEAGKIGLERRGLGARCSVLGRL